MECGQKNNKWKTSHYELYVEFLPSFLFVYKCENKLIGLCLRNYLHVLECMRRCIRLWLTIAIADEVWATAFRDCDHYVLFVRFHIYNGGCGSTNACENYARFRMHWNICEKKKLYSQPSAVYGYMDGLIHSQTHQIHTCARNTNRSNELMDLFLFTCAFCVFFFSFFQRRGNYKCTMTGVTLCLSFINERNQ